ncbi:MAG: T9SS type A sorting domain-containing protein [bacterium]
MGFVTLKVYDLLGTEVVTLVNENKQPGNYSVSFDGSNFASGIYYYKIEAHNFSQVKKMILIK